MKARNKIYLGHKKAQPPGGDWASDKTSIQFQKTGFYFPRIKFNAEPARNHFNCSAL